jgi:hypothetical protein
VDGTGSGSCPIAGSGISGVEPSDSAARELVWLDCQSTRKSDVCVLLSPVLMSDLFSACHTYNQAVSFD